MAAKSTLSASQWEKLQAGFDQAMAAQPSQWPPLLQRIGADDALVGDALSSMLEAHQRWSGRTDAAQQNLTSSVGISESVQPGDLIGPYRMVGELGHGGMGRVYLGERADGHVQQQVAIKIIQARVLDAATLERFRLERELLASFSHPNIARLYDAGESAKGHPYFVMEYVRGETLTEYCDKHRLNVRERLQLFLKVCDAVRYAHGQLVLHRDIKPGNILVDQHGLPKLIDFGIAKPLQLSGEALAFTATQQRFFSPLNVTPEQLRGERVNVACDVYQLGTVLYELLCGSPIFDLDDKTPGQIEEAILQQVPMAPSVRMAAADTATVQAHSAADSQTASKQLRGDLDDIALLALRKEPDRRYGSVEQLAEDIQRHLDNRPVLAHGQQRWYRATRYAKRHWKALLSGSVAAVLAMGFIGTLVFQSRQLTAERDRAISERRRSEEVTQFLIDVFKAAEPTETSSRHTPVGEIIDRGKSKLQSKLTDAPEIRGRMLLTLMEVYRAIDDLPTAEQLGRQAIQTYEQSPSLDTHDLIDGFDRFWDVLYATGKFDEAKEIADRALDLHGKLHSPLVKSWRSQLNRIYAVFQKSEAEACNDLFNLVESLRQNSDTRTEPLAAAELATNACRTQAGQDISRVIELIREATNIRNQLYGPDDPQTLSAKERLASVLSGSGKLEEALPFYEDLVNRRENVIGKDSWIVARTLIGRGATYADMQRIPEAEADYLRAKNIFDKVHSGKPHQDTAVTLMNLASLYDTDAGKAIDPQRADQYYQMAIAVAEKAFGDQSTNLAAFRMNYAGFKLRTNDFEAAMPMLQQVAKTMPINQSAGLSARIQQAYIFIKQGKRLAAERLIEECENSTKANPNGFDQAIKDIATLRSELAALKPH